MANIRSIGGNPIVPDQISESFGGVMPKLLAGAAQALTGSDETLATWMQRTSEQDGVAEVKSIHGNTVVWNQLFEAKQSSFNVNAGTFSYSNDDNTWTAESSSTSSNFGLYTRSSVLAPPAGHVLLFSVEVNPSVDSTVKVGPSGGFVSYSVSSGAFTQIRRLITLENSTNLSVYTTGDGTNSLQIRKAQLFDLTLMFGAGNEPATVTEFEALFPDAYYPYDAGSLLSVNMTGIETTDADGNALMTRTIPAATYFPDGLKSAGTVYDELTEDAAIQRVRERIFNGTGASWTYGTGNRFYCNLTDGVTSNSSSVHSKCDKLDLLDTGGTSSAVDGYNIALFNGTMRFFVSIEGSHSEITTVDAFNTWLSSNPITLQYELATPVTTQIDPPLNLVYKIDHGGTEEVMLDTTATAPQSAPVPMVTVYGYTADGIVDKSLSVIAPVERGKASANYAVGAYLVMGHTLYKVTTAIASGESITPGTNVTATTVMAEVIALTS